MSEASTPSTTNGVWMNAFDAPTSRMMPSSLRLEKAESRMVVEMSSAAATSISAAMDAAVIEAVFSTAKIWSSRRR